MTHSPLSRQFLTIGCCVAYTVILADRAKADSRPDISKDLESGRFSAAAESLSEYLAKQPDDDLSRFQLGAVRFFAAVERLAQDSYRYGLNPNMGMVPFFRMPVGVNPNPEAVRYDDVRGMIGRFVQAVEQAETTLAAVESPQLAWKVDLVAVRLDMNGDRHAGPDETLWSVFERFATRRPEALRPDSFTIGLDSADVHWLRGYCRLLAALGEMILAHNHQRLFDHTAQLFFTKPDSPYASLLRRSGEAEPGRPFDTEPILDAVAFIHLASFPVHEPERLAKAREHLLAMIDASRKSWELIEVETDNDREWIPGPGQASVVEGAAIDRDRLAAWRRFLDEAEAVLHGKKLIPFWRRGTDKGVNLMKVFTQPKDFDLVLWVQGSGAVPYLENGDVTSPETWAEFQRVFGGRFIGFAFWIN